MSIFNITFSGYPGQNSVISKNNIPGFLLVELVLTIFLVSVLGFYLCAWYSQLININRESIVRSKALLLACSLADKARAGELSALSSPKLDNFEVNYNIKKFDRNFDFIEIKVGWESYSGKKTFVEIVSGRGT